MILSDYKFIVASGCSYGTTLNSLDSKLIDVKLETDNKLIFIQVNCASQGADWAYDSTIYTIETLLKLGVKSENIYCFVEWTEIQRITINQPNTLHNFLNDNISNSTAHHFFIKGTDSNILSFLYNKLNIRSLNEVHNIMAIDGLFYINPLHTDPNDISKFKNVELDFYYNIWSDYEIQIPIEVKIKKYLDNILNLQRFLTQYAINYNFGMMYSQFSGWVELDDNIIHKYTIHKNKPAIIFDKCIHINPNYKINLNISESDDLIKIFPQFKHLVDKINFSNWWFYEKGGYRYGGIDEYALEEFGIYGYLTTEYDVRSNLNNIDVSHINPSFGYHPHEFIHILLTNDMMFNNPFFKVSSETITKIKEMVNEDVQSKNKTKHNLAVSELEFQKYSKIQYL